jgi:hypothetical protein
MIGTSFGTWLLVAVSLERADGEAMLFGMLAPLVMAIGSWLLTERTYRRNPDRVTALMMAGFGVKMLFVGLYLLVMLRALDVAPVPFVASFAANFVALYVIEALYLTRLFAGAFTGPARRPGL